jgi:hypothetical protein
MSLVVRVSVWVLVVRNCMGVVCGNFCVCCGCGDFCFGCGDFCLN